MSNPFNNIDYVSGDASMYSTASLPIPSANAGMPTQLQLSPQAGTSIGYQGVNPGLQGNSGVGVNKGIIMSPPFLDTLDEPVSTTLVLFTTL